MKFYHFCLCILIFAIVSCTTIAPNQKTPGFLTDYTILKPIIESSDIQVYAYTNPNVSRNDYHAVIIAPVVIYQTAIESGVTEAQIKNAQINIANSIKNALQKRMPLTSNPSKGVAKINVAITGAVLEGDGFKPRYLIPISAIIKLTTMASGFDNKKPVLVVETKTTDSLSGKLLRATVTTISGEKFRDEVHTPEEFQRLADIWVTKAMTYIDSPEKLKNINSMSDKN